MATKLKPGELVCPRCKEAIKIDASICKHCGTEFSPEEIGKARSHVARNRQYAGIGCLSLLLLLGFCTYSVSGHDPAPTVPEKPGATAKVDAVRFYRSVTTAMGPCDAAGQVVASEGQSGDAVALYRAASTMETVCTSTPNAIAAVTVPESVGKEAYSKLTEARETCEHAYVQRWDSARKMKAALDANGAVGRLAELRDSTDLVKSGAIACAAGLVGQVMSLGATQADLDRKGK